MDAVNQEMLSNVTIEALENAILETKAKIIENTKHLRDKKNLENNPVYEVLTVNMKKINEIAEQIRNKGFYAGIAGEQSSGKSFLTNVLLGFPVLPMANVTTSSAPVRIKYGKEVKINVYYYEGDNEKLKKEIDCSQISSAELASLKQYVCTCASAIGLENITYFVGPEIDTNSAKPEQLEINENDPRHIASLWLDLLAVYINQNENKEHLTSDKIEAVNERENLYKGFGLDPYVDYLIELTYDNPLLKSGLIIIDLPGLGAAVKQASVGGRSVKSHDEITLNAISNTDSMIFVFNPEAHDPKSDEIVKVMMECEAYKQRNNIGSTILPVINKIDRINRGMHIQSAAKIVSLLSSKQIYITNEDIQYVSARQAEYVFCRDGGIPFERTMSKYDDVFGHLTEEILRQIYEEKSHLNEFSERMTRFALQGRLLVTERLFRYCIEYCDIYLKLLENELESNYISYEYFETFSQELLKIVTDTMLNAFAGASEGLDSIFSGEINTHMDRIKVSIEYDVDSVVDVTLRNGLDTMKLNSEHKIESIRSQKNWLGDTVIYKASGDSTNAKIIFDELKNIFYKADFNKVQSELFEKLKRATTRLDTALEDIDAKIVNVYGDLNNKFTIMINNALSAENEEVRNSNFVRELVNNSQNIIKANANIKDNLLFLNSSNEISNEFTNVVIQIMSDLLGKLKEIPRTLDASVETSFIGRDFVTYNVLTQLIDNNFVPRDIEVNIKSSLTLGMNNKLNSFQSKMKTSKSPPASQPLKTMEQQTSEMRDNLLENRGKDKFIIIAGIKALYNEEYNQKIEKMDSSLQDSHTQLKKLSPEDFGFSDLEGRKNGALDQKIKNIIN